MVKYSNNSNKENDFFFKWHLLLGRLPHPWISLPATGRWSKRSWTVPKLWLLVRNRQLVSCKSLLLPRFYSLCLWIHERGILKMTVNSFVCQMCQQNCQQMTLKLQTYISVNYFLFSQHLILLIPTCLIIYSASNKRTECGSIHSLSFNL